jgi:hypothetical protein
MLIFDTSNGMHLQSQAKTWTQARGRRGIDSSGWYDTNSQRHKPCCLQPIALLERILLDDNGNIRPQYNDSFQVEDASYIKETSQATESTAPKQQQQIHNATEGNRLYHSDGSPLMSRVDVVAKEPVASNPLKRKFDEANTEDWLLDDEDVDVSRHLPDHSVLAKIADFFCVSFHHWIPYIHKQRLQSRVRQGVHSPGFDLVLHALIAVGMRHMSPNALSMDHIQVQQQIRNSRSIVENLAVRTVSVESLQALVLIVFDHVSHAHISRSFYIHKVRFSDFRAKL